MARAAWTARCGSLVRLPAANEPDMSLSEFRGGLNERVALDAPITDTWQLDEQLAEAERLLKAFVPLSSPSQSWPAAGFSAGGMPEHAGNVRRWDVPSAQAAAVSSNESQTGGGLLAWMFLLAGTMALVCGGVLVGWSLYASRAALWNLGLPILLGGQAALLLGVVLQVIRMWKNHSAATQRLAQVDRQLGDLQQTTTLLGNSYGAGFEHVLRISPKGRARTCCSPISKGRWICWR